jgi:uncharacterized protein YecT (DUF1311 family)
MITLALLLAAIPAHADDACANPKTTYDKTYCMSKLFVESDKELNEVYKELTKAITKEQKTKLVKVQRNWIKFRDEACEDKGTIHVKCNFQVNKERAEALRDRLRECKTGHCDDKMFEEGWQAPAKD